MDYEKDTRAAYRTLERAAAYKRHQTQDWSWARAATRQEQRRIERILRRYVWSKDDIVLDIPCGTGILAAVLNRFPFRVVASDISPEMMALAGGEYRASTFRGFVRGDIRQVPMKPAAFACVFTLGFMHRVALEIRRDALGELARLSRRLIIVSYTIDTSLQRLKKRFIGAALPRYEPAPCPAYLGEVLADFEAQGLRVRHAFHVMPLLSAELVFVLEKAGPTGPT